MKVVAFWGWIPILTKGVHFEYLISIMAHDGFMDLSESDKEFVRQILKTKEHICYMREDIEDENSNRYKVIICSKDSKIEHVLFFDGKNNLKAHAQCSICDDGFVEMKLDDDSATISDRIKPDVAERVYIVIRDVYHSHTHHDKYDDLLLHPVLADNKKDAIEKLLNQYERKIITYHKAIKVDVKEYDFNDAINLITRAKGEMGYASALVVQQREYIDDFESYKNVFLNSLQSISFLANDIELKFNNNMARLLNGLTFAIIFITLPITFDALHQLSKVIILNELKFEIESLNIIFSFTWEMFAAVIYVIFFIALIFKLRHWIIMEKNRFLGRQF